MDELPRWRQLLQSSLLWLFVLVLTAGLTLIFSFNLVTPTDIQVEANQPAREDIFAPRSITYDSQVLLQREQERVSDVVPEVYTRAEGSNVGRDQLNLVGSVFAFIDVVRADTQASTETKLSYIRAIKDLNVEEQVVLDLLNLNSENYSMVQREVSRIVGEIMRENIREDLLRDYRNRAGRDASLELTSNQERVVTNLAPQFIVPNVFPDMEATANQREEWIAAIKPFPVTIREDELIVSAGDIINQEDIEKLTMLGLLQRETDWRDVAAIFMSSLMAGVLATMYWHQFHRARLRNNARYLAALTSILLIFALIAKLLLSTPGSWPYLFPMAAMSMLLSVIFDVRLSIVMTVIMATLIGFIAPNSLELTAYTAVGGLLAALTLQDAQRLNAFFRSGVAAAVGHCVVLLIFRFNQDSLEFLSSLPLFLFALGNGVLSAAVTLFGFFIMGSLFGVTTTLQLQELSRLDHPLLQELLRRAPGTYHHSIMVAHLAEQAAENIKANSSLIRVGAFYHDIGKMNRPQFFSENQEGINPHDTLDPFTSAHIILNHVADGLELAKQHKLPDRIRDFIAEHHGQRLIKSFYHKAQELAAEDAEPVDPDQFRYPGPRPRSRESAIVMLADAIESTSRALQPNSEKAIIKLVNSLIDEDLTEGEMDESGLTLGDIRLIRASFIKTLKGRFHVRAKYPGNEELEMQTPDEPIVAEETAVADSAPTVDNGSSTQDDVEIVEDVTG